LNLAGRMTAVADDQTVARLVNQGRTKRKLQSMKI
jgi:hypothetical protein